MTKDHQEAMKFPQIVTLAPAGIFHGEKSSTKGGVSAWGKPAKFSIFLNHLKIYNFGKFSRKFCDFLAIFYIEFFSIILGKI